MKIAHNLKFWKWQILGAYRLWFIAYKFLQIASEICWDCYELASNVIIKKEENILHLQTVIWCL